MAWVLKHPVISSILAFVAALFVILLTQKRMNNVELPIFNPADLNPLLVDRTLHNVAMNHKVLDFTLINQVGDTITQKDFIDKIYVVDFFFTRCPSICPVMSIHMGAMQDVFKNDTDVKFLSLSVTPELDSIAVLKDYALKYGAIPSKWQITTGNKKHIYDLARKSYFAVADEGDGGLQDFIHSPNFVLVDKEKQIRGIYNGTKKAEMARLEEDIRLLQHIDQDYSSSNSY